VGTLPGGIVTFLFTDVEGSTRLAKEFGDIRWAELLEEHRRLLRQAFSAHGGREVDTRGDAFFVAFTRATDAVAAALDGQRALEENPWPGGGRVRVRLGLHTGEAPHNLPAERSSFIGREEEIATIQKLLAEHRLVTLTGIGGSGKTRLALRVGAQELADFPDGVFFIDLAPLGDSDLVSQTMATACGLSLGDALGGAGGSLDDQLVAALERRRCLLLVDNCEHLLDTVASLVDRILAGGPDVVLLATSREALDVEGEQIVQVPSLAVPDDPAEAEAAEAVRLFADRARSVKPGFELGSESRAPVAEICRRLDGIPLAIEFAAARIAHLSPQQIADRLQDRFRLLTGGRRRIQRQQTLAAALDWSLELLDEEERILFRRLAVFAGGFSLDAAEAVCTADDIPVASVLDLLGSLVAKSLVTAVEDERGEARYRLLETVRMYAEEKLAAAGEAGSMRSQHRDRYLGWVESIPFERLTFAPAGFAAIAREIDNLRAAADWCLGDDRPDLLARLATRLFSFWGLQTGSSAAEEGHRRFHDALRNEERLSKDERAACHAVLAVGSFIALEIELPIEEASRAIDLAGGRETPFLVIALNARAFANSVQGAFPGADPHFAADARRDTRAAVAAARSGMPAEWKAYAELFGWMIESNLGDARAAARWARACTETCSVAEDPEWLRRAALAGLAVSHHLLGETDEALRAAVRFGACSDVVDSPLGWGTSAFEVTPALVAGGQNEVAFQVLRDAARDVRRGDTPLAGNHVLSVIAVVEQLRGHPERAGRLLAAARHLGGATNLPIPFRTPASVSFYRHYLPIVRATLGPDEARRARDDGRTMTLDDALAYALESLG
jgi:predicted ATPase